MRSDMFEVIIERPRVGASWPDRTKGRKAELAINPELSPLREPMSIGRGSKYLNENLAPLRRFLERNVGRPWDAVRAEICAHLAVRSAVQKHVLDHVKEMVETNAVMIDGRPHHPIADGPRRDRYRPIRAYRGWKFYVCPKTGLLRLPPLGSRRKKDPPPNPDVRPLGEMREARRINGVWYDVTLAKVPDNAAAYRSSFDVLLKAALNEPGLYGWNGALQETYGRADRYAVAKRQLSKREIRALGLAGCPKISRARAGATPKTVELL
jgi:hypothetical protein